eukprot:5752768-Amphidinium_carterae.1
MAFIAAWRLRPLVHNRAASLQVEEDCKSKSMQTMSVWDQSSRDWLRQATSTSSSGAAGLTWNAAHVLWYPVLKHSP